MVAGPGSGERGGGPLHRLGGEKGLDGDPTARRRRRPNSSVDSLVGLPRRLDALEPVVFGEAARGTRCRRCRCVGWRRCVA
jgi:hypothetical protein